MFKPGIFPAFYHQCDQIEKVPQAKHVERTPPTRFKRSGQPSNKPEAKVTKFEVKGERLYRWKPVRGARLEGDKFGWRRICDAASSPINGPT